ncbi:hypothetical protein ABEB36_011966 [Hypothenemus hampei]|uniref:Pseudouridine-5'-phosphatase n=1 Tax=Hypothenemus hampei TaxID=57062 RepID=A0ABD1E9P6_HYPHA
MHKHCCKTNKYHPVTHVIFDLDGTIIDSEKVYERALKKAVEECGKEYYDEFINEVKGCTENEVGKIATKTFNLDISIAEFVKKFNDHSRNYLTDLDLMPGAERLINHLHSQDIPLAIATSSNQESFELKTKKYSDLFCCFHHIVCGGSDPEVKNSKPAPDIFLIAAQRFDDNPDPSKCLIFEDSKNGMLGALAAGMQVVMTPESHVSYDVWKLATMRLDSLNYMLPELFGLPAFPQEDIATVFTDIKVDLTEVYVDFNLNMSNEIEKTEVHEMAQDDEDKNSLP